MPLVKINNKMLWNRYEKKEKTSIEIKWSIAIIIMLVCFQYVSSQTMWGFVSDAPRQASDLIGRMFPPDVKYFGKVGPALWDTITISIYGTVVAVLISIPLAILAARNTTPNTGVRGLILAIIVASRSVNSIIWALIIVQLVGPGLFASILAIGIRSLGMVSKLFYEAIEEINKEPIEAIAATGANKAQIFLYGYVPQLLPNLVSVSVYRWEINIRESTIIGFVGGGGIGLLLNSAINRLAWNQVIVILITILLTVLVSEVVSNKIKKVFL